MIKKIPVGRETTYKILAKACGRSKACRAVSRILNANNYSFLSRVSKKDIIPCHRVICSNGRLGGPACRQVLERNQKQDCIIKSGWRIGHLQPTS